MKQKEKSPVNFLPYLIIAAFAFILYGNTLKNDYALDDLLVVKGNAFTQKGFAGIGEIFRYDSFTGFFGKQKKLVAGGRYRPLSIASFAVEYGLFNGFKPGFSHFMNILLYALTGIVLFEILRKLIRPEKNKLKHKTGFLFDIPFIAAMLFMAHPVHTEAVANIKGRDEILALLFSLLTVWFVIRALETKKDLNFLMAGIAFFLGLLSKENTIMFIAITPLTVYFFTDTPLKRNLTATLPLVFAAVLFIFIRFLVLGYLNSGELPRELLNNPFLGATAGQKAGTILYTLGLYLKLLLFPVDLTNDYNPYHIPLVPLSDLRAIVPLIIYMSLLFFVVWLFRKKSLVSFGILFYLITLFIVSNIIFPVGTFMGERFLYMPSVGFAVIVAWFFAVKAKEWLKNSPAYPVITAGILGIVLLLFTIKTIARNSAWENDFTLFSTDVKVSENSTKCNTSAGGQYFEKAQRENDTVLRNEYFRISMGYLKKGLVIYPENKNCLLLMGNVFALYNKDYPAAISKYMEIFSLDGYNPDAFRNAIMVLNGMDNSRNSDYKISIGRKMTAVFPDNADLNYMLGKIYGQFKPNLDSAVYFLERSAALAPDKADAYKDLGVIYGMKGDFGKALAAFKKASELDPGDAQVRQNLEITYQLLHR